MIRDEAIAIVKAARIRPEALNAIAFLVETSQADGEMCRDLHPGNNWWRTDKDAVDVAAATIRGLA